MGFGEPERVSSRGSEKKKKEVLLFLISVAPFIFKAGDLFFKPFSVHYGHDIAQDLLSLQVNIPCSPS